MKRLLLGLFLLAAAIVYGQQSFSINIVPLNIPDLPPVYAYAHAQHDGKWLIIGGETSTEEGFNIPNTQLIVVDPVFKKVWTASLEDLYFYIDEVEHITAAFAQSYQDGGQLYLLGGYGYSSEQERYTTFPYLTIIQVDQVIEAVTQQRHDQIGPAFCQYYDEDFALMNGYLTEIDHKFYLIGGVRHFGEESVRTDRVIQFVLREDGPEDLSIIQTGMYAYEDGGDAFPTCVPQIFPDQTNGVTLFHNEPGEQGQRLTWMNIYDVGYSSYVMADDQIPHYHSAFVPVYDASYNTMHSLFIGGCEDYLCTGEDTFGAPRSVDSFTRFSREVGGKVVIEKEALPAFQMEGQQAQFVPHQAAPYYPNGVLKLDPLPENKTLIGYLYGGISRSPRGTRLEEGYLARASNQVYAVYLAKENVLIGALNGL